MNEDQFTEIEVRKERILELCPNVKTIEETYPNNKGYIDFICRNLECSSSQFLLTPEQYNNFIQYKCD